MYVALQHSVGAGTTVGTNTVPSLITITIDEIGYGLDHHIFTAVGLVNAHIARTLEVNRLLNAVLEINPDALDMARELDAELDLHESRGIVPHRYLAS